MIVVAACNPAASAFSRPSPREWAEQYPVRKTCEDLVEQRRAEPLAAPDSMAQPLYMDVGSEGTPGEAGVARFVVTEQGLIDEETVATAPELDGEPRRKLLNALSQWRFHPARENGCFVASWFSYVWGS